jgi:hypothetical protein
LSFTAILRVNQLTEKTCQVCQSSFNSSESRRYCYLHRQVYDSLRAEFDAIRKTDKGSDMDWKKFLSEKKNGDRYLPKELDDVIIMELDST